jgi:hypothetical protein
MSMASWLRRLDGFGDQGQMPAPRSAKPPFIPQLMVLEDRTLPSTFTVLNFNDAGPGSSSNANDVFGAFFPFGFLSLFGIGYEQEEMRGRIRFLPTGEFSRSLFYVVVPARLL